VKAVYSPADMAKPNEIVELITLGENTFGSVDVLVNNAGVQHAALARSFRPTSGMQPLRLACPPPSEGRSWANRQHS
jgi:NAD(P)-dependent dehydrogenase (short-subunit alcohol dehydrogenase family)